MKAANISVFPYDVPDKAEKVDETIEIDGNTSCQPRQFIASNPGEAIWRSTGLYAKAGDIVSLSFPEHIVGKIKVIILFLNNKIDFFSNFCIFRYK